MLLSHFGRTITPEEVIASVPVRKRANGEDWGTPMQEIARWCLGEGFAVELHSADFQVLDTSWAKLSPDDVIGRMEAAKAVRDIPSLGKESSELYMQTYIDLVRAGGKLVIEPYISSHLLDELLAQGPIIASLCFNVLHQTGRVRSPGLRENVADDIAGGLANHAVVVYGKGDHGQYLVADPWQQPGRLTFEPERLLSAMCAAQMECDNVLFQIRPIENSQ